MSPRSQGRPVAHRVAGAVALALVLAASACAGEPGEIDWPEDPPPRSAAVEPSPTLDAAEAAAIEEILTTVTDFRQAELASYGDPQPPPLARRDLATYLADPLLSQTLDTLNDMYAGGMAFEGTPAGAPTVADLRLEDSPPTATVRECVDANGWRLVFQETGEPVPGEGFPDRYVARLHLKLYPDGWMVYRIEMTEEEQC